MPLRLLPLRALQHCFGGTAPAAQLAARRRPAKWQRLKLKDDPGHLRSMSERTTHRVALAIAAGELCKLHLARCSASCQAIVAGCKNPQ